MNRSNLLNGLMGLTVIAGLLVGYNALVASKGTKSPSTKLASYLNLTQAKQETKSDEDKVAGTDNGAETPAPTPAAETPATEPTPAAEAPATVTETPAEPTPTATTPAPAATSTPAPGAKAATTYTVKEGDTYGCIAEKYYGSFENWVNVDNANPNTEGFAEYRLFVGAVLTLPALSADQVRPASSLCQ